MLNGILVGLLNYYNNCYLILLNTTCSSSTKVLALLSADIFCYFVIILLETESHTQ